LIILHLILYSSSINNHMEREYFAHETAVIDDDSKIGKGTKIWHFSHIMTGAEIGENCNIGQNVVISPGVKLGRNVKVQNNVSLYTGVICEDDVFLGPSMVFTNVINPRSAIIRKDNYYTTIVEKGASIGANSTIVTKEVKPYALVVGNPARQTGWMSEYGHKLIFDNVGFASCPESGERYKIEDGKVSKIF
jgi:UDP-2-acetamido-3-amino-2,3-dideoxy-glucuronate N-acetyltransferase